MGSQQFGQAWIKDDGKLLDASAKLKNRRKARTAFGPTEGRNNTNASSALGSYNYQTTVSGWISSRSNIPTPVVPELHSSAKR
jgi:hypothetical protein